MEPDVSWTVRSVTGHLTALLEMTRLVCSVLAVSACSVERPGGTACCTRPNSRALPQSPGSSVGRPGSVLRSRCGVTVTATVLNVRTSRAANITFISHYIF